ncbi:MAG: dihydrofolate reductase family protein [Acidimicrobiales bacterium]
MADTTRGARGMSAGIVLWQVTMSLDGFIAGPDDAMDWVFEYPEPNPAVDEVIGTTGAILAGRRTYDVGRRDVGKPSGQAFGGAWTGPQLVLTHDVPDGSDDPSVTFLGGDITNAVNRALTAARGKNVLVLGANVAKQCIDAGLLDEVLVHLAPVLLGDGVRLFGGPGFGRVDLEPISVERVGRLANLRFRVAEYGYPE